MQKSCPNCGESVEKALEWICWECGWEIGFTCWFCDHFNKGVDIEKCSNCGCPK